MIVFSPCDLIEAKKVTLASAKLGKPAYIRLAREKTPVITTEDSPFEVGKGQLLYGEEGAKADVGIVATGALVYRALKVAEDLKKENISAKVLNISTIKPLDDESVINLAKTCGAIVSVEEHQIAGGLGSAVSECLSKNLPTPQEFVGVKDLFGQSGKQEELLEHYGMGESSIKEACKKVIGKKS